MANMIKAMRLDRKFTQEETAIAIGISHRSYFRKEKEPKNFKMGELLKLAVFFQVEVEDFFKNELTISVI